MGESSAAPIAPPRTVGWAGTSLMPLNGMIGAGIFALPAILYASVGNFAPWMILLGGIFFFPLVWCFARLAARFDHSGGPILYGKAAFGSFVGFQSGWGRYASGIVTEAANAHVAISYAAAVWPLIGDEGTRPWAVASFQLFFILINLFGMKSAVRTLGGMTLVKLSPLALLILAGLLWGDPAIGLRLPEFTAIEGVVLLTFYAFMGFEAVVMSAGEMKRPKRDVPWALVAMLGGVTVLYALICWAFIAIDPLIANDDTAPLAVAAVAIAGPAGAITIAIAATFSIAANDLNGYIANPRMTYGMAEQGMLPRWFMHVSPRFRSPNNSILFYGAACMFFGLIGGFEFLAIAGTLTRLVMYVVTAAALPVIARREDGRVGLADIAMAAIALASSLWVATHAKPDAWLAFGALIGVGTLLYFIARRAISPPPGPVTSP
jgi:amino acid transporter